MNTVHLSFESFLWKPRCIIAHLPEPRPGSCLPVYVALMHTTANTRNNTILKGKDKLQDRAQPYKLRRSSSAIKDYVTVDPKGAEGVGSEFAADAHAVAAVGGQEWYDYAEFEGKSCTFDYD
uniref:Uncharacterized protein n=1 Tax=Leersia perrieri TaxID=77586 RepID=A0A0D9VVY2_9ORYZ